MRRTILAFCCITAMQFTFGQTPSQEYFDFIRKADSLYFVKDYKASAIAYSDALRINGGIGNSYDQYNAAATWALAGEPDSAFFNLESFTAQSGYSNYDYIVADTELVSLHIDVRWQPLLATIKANKDKVEASIIKPVPANPDSSSNEINDVPYLYLNIGGGFSENFMFGIGVNFIFSNNWGFSINHNQLRKHSRNLPFDYHCSSDDCNPVDTFLFSSIRLVREFALPTKLIRIGAEAGFAWVDYYEANFTYDYNNSLPEANYISEYKIRSTMGLSLRAKLEFPLLRNVGFEIAWLSIIDKFQWYAEGEFHLTIGIVRDRIKPKRR